MRITRIILKTLLITGISAITIMGFISDTNENKATQRLNGSYKVKVFVLNKDTLLPLTTDTLRWNKMIIGEGYIKITTMADSSAVYASTIDTVKRTLLVSSYSDSTKKYLLSYKSLPDNYFSLSGIYKKDSITVCFKKKTLKDYRLINRSFHWINEYPFNR